MSPTHAPRHIEVDLSVATLLGVLVVAWILFLIGGGFFVILLVLLYFLRLFLLSRKHAFWFLALSPLVLLPPLSFAHGAFSYATGNASLRGTGYPGAEFSNLHPVYRCHRRTSGCKVDGSESFHNIPNNLAIAMMHALIGPMPGSYHGVYPRREEARALLQSPEAQPYPDAYPDTLPRPHPGIRNRLLDTRLRYELGRPLRFLVVGGECIVIGDGQLVSLYDAQTGKWFAVYGYGYSGLGMGEGDGGGSEEEGDPAHGVRGTDGAAGLGHRRRCAGLEGRCTRIRAGVLEIILPPSGCFFNAGV